MSKHDTRAVHPKRRNKISGQFAARSIEMLESPAYRVLSRAAHLVVSRLEIELAHHGGNDNGHLPVTVDQFVEYGIHHRGSVAPAIREAEALGFIRVTERGRGGNAEYRSPNKFYLTFAHGRGSKAQPPTHDWRRIKTMEEAERIAAEARKIKDHAAVVKGQAAWTRRKKQPPKNISRYRFPVPKPVPVSGPETANFPGPETGTTASGPETGTTSISGERGAKRTEDGAYRRG